MFSGLVVRQRVSNGAPSPNFDALFLMTGMKIRKRGDISHGRVQLFPGSYHCRVFDRRICGGGHDRRRLAGPTGEQRLRLATRNKCVVPTQLVFVGFLHFVHPSGVVLGIVGLGVSSSACSICIVKSVYCGSIFGVMIIACSTCRRHVTRTTIIQFVEKASATYREEGAWSTLRLSAKLVTARIQQ